MSIGMTETQEFMRNLADVSNEYAGIPMPVDGERLVIHPSYRFAHALKHPEEPSNDDYVNSWRSEKLNATVFVFRENGKLKGALLPDQPFEIERILRTFGLNGVWSLDAERKAIDKLATLVSHHKFRGYMLTGSFIETSSCSKITYIFRRLRPTIALSTSTGYARFLASLCLHPIGYYDESFAGCMVPTDEVIAHLVLMRGDEHAFWKWSNQHQQIQ